MLAVAAATQLIAAHVPAPDAETVPLTAALDRFLATEARADADSPAFDASAMDGYALRRAEAGAPLRMVGTIAAGTAASRPPGPGECFRIFTGAPVPPGVDCVVPQEDTVREGDCIRIPSPGAADFIRRRGENRRAGEIVVPAGTRLGPPELAALAGAGVAHPVVARRPRCLHLATGDELVAPDQTPAAAQLRDSNSTLIAALLARHGGDLVGHARVRDELAAARATVAGLPAADLLLISGGASVGARDFARPLLTALGFTLHFEQLDLRPGKPLVFATRGAQLAFALPGNPVSHWVVFQLFLAPLLRQWQTGRAAPFPRLTGRLAAGHHLPPPSPRSTFWPARAEIAAGGFEVTPLPLASSGDSSGLVSANALLPLPANGLDAAQSVEFISCP